MPCRAKQHALSAIKTLLWGVLPPCEYPVPDDRAIEVLWKCEMMPGALFAAAQKRLYLHSHLIVTVCGELEVSSNQYHLHVKLALEDRCS